MFPTIPTSAVRPWIRSLAANICLPGDGLSLEQAGLARLQLPPASTHAEVAVPSLDDWEKGWKEKLKAETLKPEMPILKLLPADFRSAVPPVAQAN